MYDKQCKTCGTSLTEFYNNGMLGCPGCYKAFGQEINATLKKIQGAYSHVGKKPRINGIDKELLKEYQLLLLEKEKAGLSGDFQRVAELLEDISELKLELKARGLL